MILPNMTFEEIRKHMLIDFDHANGVINRKYMKLFKVKNKGIQFMDAFFICRK